MCEIVLSKGTRRRKRLDQPIPRDKTASFFRGLRGEVSQSSDFELVEILKLGMKLLVQQPNKKTRQNQPSIKKKYLHM
jgi:hypothetical protein